MWKHVERSETLSKYHLIRCLIIQNFQAIRRNSWFFQPFNFDSIDLQRDLYGLLNFSNGYRMFWSIGNKRTLNINTQCTFCVFRSCSILIWASAFYAFVFLLADQIYFFIAISVGEQQSTLFHMQIFYLNHHGINYPQNFKSSSSLWLQTLRLRYIIMDLALRIWIWAHFLGLSSISILLFTSLVDVPVVVCFDIPVKISAIIYEICN